MQLQEFQVHASSNSNQIQFPTQQNILKKEKSQKSETIEKRI
jgi:hypothetical protein